MILSRTRDWVKDLVRSLTPTKTITRVYFHPHYATAIKLIVILS